MTDDYVEHAAQWIPYFEEYCDSEPSFIPERDTAISVVSLMREHSATSSKLEMIVRLMRDIDSVDHYDGSGWHAFKNAVRWWLEARGTNF